MPVRFSTRLSDLCYLSHKTASKLRLLNSATAITFSKSSNEFFAFIHYSEFSPETTSHSNFTEHRKMYNVQQYTVHWTQMFCA